MLGRTRVGFLHSEGLERFPFPCWMCCIWWWLYLLLDSLPSFHSYLMYFPDFTDGQLYEFHNSFLSTRKFTVRVEDRLWAEFDYKYVSHERAFLVFVVFFTVVAILHGLLWRYQQIMELQNLSSLKNCVKVRRGQSLHPKFESSYLRV